jgi:hypothetical protein
VRARAARRAPVDERCVGGKNNYTWIELAQRAAVDPHALVLAQLDALLALVRAASNVRCARPRSSARR